MKLKITLLSAFMCLCFFAALAGPKNSDRKKLATYMESKNYEKAIVLLKDILADYPKNEEMNYLLGRSYFESSYYDKKSIEVLEHTVSIVKEDKDILIAAKYFLARAYHVNSRFDDAIKIFQELKNKKMYLDEEMHALIDKRLKEATTAKKICASPLNIEIKNASILNSKFDDYNTCLSVNENELFLTSRLYTKKALKSTNGKYSKRVYFSKYENSSWGKKKIYLPVSRLKNCENLFLSKDGNTMLVTSSSRKDVDGEKSDIYILHKEKGVWSKPKKMSSRINSKYADSYPFLSKDGKTLYFSSNRPKGNGGFDIYSSQMDKKGKWTEAVNLGNKINTNGNEISPCIYDDVLYFSSNGIIGVGGYDIYLIKRNSDKTWSKVENMGYPYNSVRDDISFAYYSDKKRAFLSSSRKGTKGGLDLYDIDLNAKVLIVDTLEKEKKRPITVVPEKIDTVVVAPVVAPEEKVFPLIVKDKPVQKEHIAKPIVFEKEPSKMTILEALAFRKKYALKGEEFYTVQLAAYSYRLPANTFGSLTNNLSVIKGNDGNYKYIYGKYNDVFDAKTAMDKIDKNIYPDAFLRIIKDGREGKIIRMRD